jgi:TolB-like protein
MPPPANEAPSVKLVEKPRRRGPLLVVALVFSHLALLVAGLVVGILIGYLFTERGPAHPRGSVAILPITGDWEPAGAKDVRNFLEISLPDAIARDIVEQTTHGNLKVIATHETRNVQHFDAPSRVGTALGVSAVLSGKVRKDGQLSVQLIAANSGELIWSSTYRLALDQAGSPHLDPNSQQEIANMVRQKLAAR